VGASGTRAHYPTGDEMKIYQLKIRNSLDSCDWFAVVSKERGFIVGDIDAVRILRDRLDRFLVEQKPDGTIHRTDERIEKWLSIAESLPFAREYGYTISASTIRLACASGKITDAKLNGKAWRFPLIAFFNWLQNGTHKRWSPQRERVLKTHQENY
jgi:hypothetical protein